MPSDTATIRVSRETRDLLAERARARGLSLSAMLSELARDVAREAIFRSERDATSTDSGTVAVEAEERGWAAAARDGIA